jgi:regulator of sirC expression with transglutaminase-like and TPR domain
MNELNTIESARNAFANLADSPRGPNDLVRGALLIARLGYPDLDESLYRQYLKNISDRIRPRMADAAGMGAKIGILNHLLFDEEGFRGNGDQYFDPDNSFLNRVIDRRRGIPVTLAVIYMGVGRAVGLDIVGIALPGHFLTAVPDVSGRIFIDPFNRGEILSTEECRQRMGRWAQQPGQVDPRQIPPAGRREILARILRNLKTIYIHTQREMNVLEVLHWILAIQPDAAIEWRERGMRYEAMGNARQAVEDFKRYLEIDPETEDREWIERRIRELSRYKQWLH